MSSETAKRTPKGEGETVSVTLHLPKALYVAIKAAADADDREVREYLRVQIKRQFVTPEVSVDGSAG